MQRGLSNRAIDAHFFEFWAGKFMYNTPVDLDDRQRVMAAATRVAQGDSSRAQNWYREERLAAFSGKTPAQLVAEGRAADLLRYLESVEQGPSG